MGVESNVLRRLLAPEYLVKQEHRLGDLPDGKTAYNDVMRIALPSIIEMVLMSLIGTVDTIMVGNELGAEGLSSVGLPTQPRMVLLCLFFALNVGITAIVARRRGEERQEDANATLRNALMLALGLSLFLALLWVRVIMMILFAGGALNTALEEESAKPEGEKEEAYTDYFRGE